MSDPANEDAVRFLNADVDPYGVRDRAALLRGFGKAIVVLYEGADAGGPDISFELSGADARTLAGTIAELIALVRALPDDARVAWNAATRRVFDIGIQSGRTPHSTPWSIEANVLTALGEINADLVITVYGADRAGAEGDFAT